MDAESGKMIRTADYDTEISLSQLFKDGLSQIAVSLSNETDLNQQLKKTNTLTQSYKLPYKSALENYNAGLTNLNIDNLVDAEYFFNQTIKIDPSYAPAISGLADVMIKYNDPIEANKFLIQAVNIDEDFRGQFDILYKQFPDTLKSYDDLPGNHSPRMLEGEGKSGDRRCCRPSVGRQA